MCHAEVDSLRLTSADCDRHRQLAHVGARRGGHESRRANACFGTGCAVSPVPSAEDSDGLVLEIAFCRVLLRSGDRKGRVSGRRKRTLPLGGNESFVPVPGPSIGAEAGRSLHFPTQSRRLVRAHVLLVGRKIDDTIVATPPTQQADQKRSQYCGPRWIRSCAWSSHGWPEGCGRCRRQRETNGVHGVSFTLIRHASSEFARQTVGGGVGAARCPRSAAC